MITMKSIFKIILVVYVFGGKALGKFDPIAFDLQMSHTFVTDNARTVPYNVTVTNHNFARIQNGVFTCTKQGVYKFQAYVFTTAGSRFFLDLFVNQNVATSLFAHGNSQTIFSGNAIIVSLDVGDTVRIQTRGTYTSALMRPPNFPYSQTFVATEMGSLSLEHTPLIAFSATSKVNQIVLGGAAVRYDTLLYDSNGTLDMRAGTFHAPVSGYYIFHFFGFSQSNKVIILDLMINADFICSLYGNVPYNHASAGNTVIVHVDTGDTVSVVGHANTTNHIFGAYSQAFTSFSGAMVVSDDDLHNPETEPVELFSAGSRNITSLGSNHNIIFGTVFSNVGDAYNNKAGIFTARVSGVYEFNVHVHNTVHLESQMMIQRNNISVANVYATGSHMGNSVILELDGGDQINVATTHYTYFINQDNHFNITTCMFSGHLLYAHNPDKAFVG